MIDHFFEHVNTSDYYGLLMNDLSLILPLKQIEINEFFEISQAEKKDSRVGCNIELNFMDVELPVFSDQQFEYIRVNDFENFHNMEKEIAEKIIKNDQDKDELILKDYETEHMYIDFSELIIGDKIKKISQIKKKSDVKSILRFDDIYYSKYMLNTTNLDFYLQESVQKIIDFQWVQTKKIMKC